LTNDFLTLLQYFGRRRRHSPGIHSSFRYVLVFR
jgi:hypothetical protein